LPRRQADTAWAYQAGIRRLETPEDPARGTLYVNVLVVRAAKGAVGRACITIGDRHEAEDNTARIDLNNAANAGASWVAKRGSSSIGFLADHLQ
jgi:hypothetical protein